MGLKDWFGGGKKKEQFREAWDCFSKAAELVPQSNEFRQKLAKADAAGGKPL